MEIEIENSEFEARGKKHNLQTTVIQKVWETL